MKKILLFLLIAFITSACGQLQQNKNETFLEKQEGIIVQKIEQEDRNNQILLIPNIQENDIDNKTVDKLITLLLK